MDGTDAVASLLEARLTVPRPQVRTVPRPRVVELLDAAVHRHPLTIVVGGAGTGKTLAVSEWIAHGNPPGPVAWVSVDPGLRTTHRFWAALRQAVGRALTLPARVPASPVVDEDLVDAFTDALAGRELCIVVDDAHELDGGAAWDGIELLLGRLPEGVHVVLTARHDPPVALHRLRVSGELGELRAADLAFTDVEARALLDEGNVHLAPAELEHLTRVTDGWAAGLRLALMTIESAEDPAEAARGFSGRERVVAGYLMEEVLRQLDPDQAELLRRTAITERICGPLAEVLTGDMSAGLKLDALAGGNALVVELGTSGWYRYHPLMAQMLRAKLHVEDPALERELHRHAALWFRDRDERLPALDHALLTHDWDLVARVALGSAAVLGFTPDRASLGEVIDRLPPQAAHGRADLLVVRALGAFCRGDFESEAALRTAASPHLPALPEPRHTLAALVSAVLDAAAARRRGDAPALVEHAGRALESAARAHSTDAPGWAAQRGFADALVAIGEYWSGNPTQAQQLLYGALAHTARAEIDDDFGRIYFQGYFALTEAALGRIATARTIAGDALRIGGQSGSPVRYEARTALLALAATEVQRGELVAAARAIEQGRLAAARGNDPFASAGLGMADVARALLLQDLPSARRHLADLDGALTACPRMTFVARQTAALRVEVEVATGALVRAAAAVAAADDRPEDAPAAGEPDPLVVARARLHLAWGRIEDARAVVAPLLHMEGSVGAEGWVVVALAEDRLRHDAAASEALARAIALAGPEEARYPFHRTRDRLGPLLRRHLDVVGTHREFVESLPFAVDAPWPQPGTLLDPLTDRELSVLAYLPTMRSNEEIAQQLGISVNTVKQHLKSIHRKLGVGTRRDAVRTARALGLLATRDS